MKKNKFYLLAMMLMAMLCISFVSCDKEDLQIEGDDDEEITGEGLVGTWKFVSVVNYYKDESRKPEKVDYTQYDSLYKLFYKFNENGTGKLYEWEKGDGWYVDPFNYTFDGKKIIAPENEGDTEIDVVKLTSTELIIKADEDLDDEDVAYMEQTYKRVSESAVAGAE